MRMNDVQMWLIVSRAICFFLGVWFGEIIFKNDRKDKGSEDK